MSECVALAPLYAAFLFGGLGLYVAVEGNRTGTASGPEAFTELAFGVGLFLTIGAVIAASEAGVLPATVADPVVRVATPIGYFGILVTGPFALAGVIVLIGSTAIVISHRLVGEYA